MINDKKLFTLMLKYNKIVQARYRYLIRPPYGYREEVKRIDFDAALLEAKEEVNHEILCSGRDEDGYRYSFPDYLFYLGKDGWKKYGIFSYIPFYRRVKWTESSIEKYKESIAWVMLLEFGDVSISEKLLRECDDFVPWNDMSFPNGRNPYYSNGITVIQGTTISQFQKINELSEDFILAHLDLIDRRSLYSSGKFKLTRSLFEALYNYELEQDLRNMAEYRNYESQNKEPDLDPFLIQYEPNPNKFKDSMIYDFSINSSLEINYELVKYIATSTQITNWKYLLINMDLTSEQLFDFYSLDSDVLDVFFNECFDKRRRILSLIEQNVKFHSMIDEKVLKQLYQGGDFLATFKNHRVTDFYSYDFSIETIKKNMEKWNEIQFEYLDHVQRTPDTNYHYYKSVTMWDILANEKTILLTYDLCKFLRTLSVKTGGIDTYDDGTYHSGSTGFCAVNALDLFQYRGIKDENEMEMILNDMDLVECFLANTKLYYDDCYQASEVVDKIITYFFEDFSYRDFKDLVSQFTSS